ncbi:hypothetical protein [Streptomyces sp. NRRL F-2580]|uniref:hypothetical protein n=1 Tax=Streptomyces sp. NRRL F-2580 TaxID=1463841 RepID=UPI0004C80B1C|nr:hypothetical protein [Streptomyces sp. NRRL F-2580]
MGRTASNEPLKAAQEEIDESWQQDLEALLTKGVQQGQRGAARTGPGPCDRPTAAPADPCALAGPTRPTPSFRTGPDREPAFSRRFSLMP